MIDEELVGILDKLQLDLLKKTFNLNCVVHDIPKQDAASAAGVTPAHLSGWLAGYRKLSNEQKIKLIRLLRLEPTLRYIVSPKKGKDDASDIFIDKVIPDCLAEDKC